VLIAAYLRRIAMDVFVARTALVPSNKSPLTWDCEYAPQPIIGDDYCGAHADGYDSADYELGYLDWAKMVMDAAGTHLECYLFLAAARDYVGHAQRCEDRDEQPLPRGKWCEAHVAGQIDRALEIADEI
jgi:hypothetical protein